MDLKKILEEESGLELDWYFNYFINTSKNLDYAIKGTEKSGKQTVLNLINKGGFPMPVDITVVGKDGIVLQYHIPINMTMGSKISPENIDVVNCAPWSWTAPEYQLKIDIERKNIDYIELDPKKRTMDLNRANNVYPVKN